MGEVGKNRCYYLAVTSAPYNLLERGARIDRIFEYFLDAKSPQNSYSHSLDLGEMGVATQLLSLLELLFCNLDPDGKMGVVSRVMGVAHVSWPPTVLTKFQHIFLNKCIIINCMSLGQI